MKHTLLAASLVALLQGCGGGGSSGEPAAQKTPDALIAIGNSITVYPANPDISWTHTSGMAASDEAHDYVHLVAATRGLQATAFNVAPLERDSSRADLIQASTAMIDNRTVVIVEIGENAAPGGSAQFSATYSQLLDAVAAKHPAELVCLSDYWADPPKDAAKKAACTSHGGRFVNVGGIYYAHLDTIAADENAAIHDHPHDPSMAEIAKAILSK